MEEKRKLEQLLLMHKNIQAAIIVIDVDTDAILKTEILNETHMPIGHSSPKAFSNWLNRRAIPKHQQNQDILHYDQSNFNYMIQNLGISLVDCYWLKPLDSDLSWEKVNLYDNNFCEIDFRYSDIDNISALKPSATTQGELQKRWGIIDGKRVLIKGNYGAMYRQSINEKFATLLHEKQGKQCTKYELFTLPTTLGEGLGCISENFTTKSLEFVPAYDVTFYSKQPNTVSVYQYYIDTCVELGVDRRIMQDYMDYQIMSDFLLTNTDRHLLNLGILRDPDTLKFICPAPIYDTGNSMFYNTVYNPDTVSTLSITSFYKTELKMLEQVQNKDILDLSKIPTIDELKTLYAKDPYNVVYLDNLIQGYEKKIEMIRAFQKGYSLNPRSNNYYQNNKDLER